MKTTTQFLLTCLIAIWAGAWPASGEDTMKSESDVASSASEHVMLRPDEVKWTDAKALPPGAQMAVMEGDPSKPGPFTIRFKAPAGYKVPPHWHPADEHVTVISGRILMGMGEQVDESKTHELPVGGFSVMPAGLRHFVLIKEDSVVQVHGTGPWGISYVNPADDPRGK